MENCGLLEMKMVEIFEYEKNNNEYWDKTKLHKQIVNKTLLITEVLYPGYSFLFLFDNITSHSVYAKDILQIQEMNKSIRGKQVQLHNSWFEREEV